MVRIRMWALNKNDWPWLLLGFMGAIMVGGTFPSDGVFIAHAQARLCPLFPPMGNLETPSIAFCMFPCTGCSGPYFNETAVGYSVRSKMFEAFW